MALNKGTIRVPFVGGVETKITPEAVPAARLLALENGVFTRAVSIRKRNGYAALSRAVDGDEGPLTGLRRLARRGEELLGFTLGECASYEPQAAQWTAIEGGVYSLVGSDRAVVRTGTEQTAPDHATLDGVNVYAWEDSRGGVWYSVIDEAGHIHRGPVQADAAGISPRCLAVGNALHIYYVRPASGEIYSIVISPSAPHAIVPPAVMVGDLNTTNPVYDACATPRAGTPALIAWHERGTSNLRVGYVDASGQIGSPASGHPSPITDVAGLVATSPIAVAYALDSGLEGGGAIFVASVGAATGRLRTMSGGGEGAALAAAFPIAAEVSVVSSPYTTPVNVQRLALGISSERLTAWLAFEEAAAHPSNRYCVPVNVGYTAAASSNGNAIRSVGLASRAWAAAGTDDVFAYFVHDTTYFNVYLALRIGDPLCVARTLPGRAGDAPGRAHLPSAHVDGAIVRVALPYNERVESENDDEFTETGIRLVTLDYDHPDSHQNAQLGAGLYLGGACPMHYDGARWTEQGFHVGPERITTTNGGAGSLTSESTYLYRVWYEAVDAQGEIHRGPVSFGTLITLGVGEDEVILTLPTLRVTRKTTVRICVARSRAAETGATAQLFRVSSYDPSTAGSPNGYVANDPTVDSVTFTDRMSDADLEEQEPLYTNGGILSSDPAPLGHLIAEGKGRLFWNDPSDENVVRHSQEVEEGYAVEAPPELRISIPPAGGPLTALAVGDDGTVLVFKREAIFAFGGAGPLANGDTAAQGFSEPVRLRSPVGCDAPASIAVAPVAVLFKSGLGIWQVDGAGQVSYVGAPVEAYNAQRITAAAAMPGRTQILFISDEGPALLYDFFFGQWSTFTNHEGRGIAIVDGALHYLRTDERVFRETPGSYSDAGVRIVLRLETSWLHLVEALQGFQRIWNVLVLGTWLSPHQLAISHRTDYAPGQMPTSEPSAWSDPVYLDATGEDLGSPGWIAGANVDAIGVDPILGDNYGNGNYGEGPYGGEGADVYQWRYHVGERGQSIQLRFQDYERVGLAGASFEITELLIEGGVAGPSKRPFGGPRSG